MKIEQFRQRAGVTEKYVPGAGATPVQWTCRVGSAALVAPASSSAQASYRQNQEHVQARVGTDSGRNEYRTSSVLGTGAGPEPVPELTQGKYQHRPLSGQRGTTDEQIQDRTRSQ